MNETDHLAAEHALGLLEGADLIEAQRLMLRDPAFARAVADWQARLAPMLDEVAPAEPGSDIWPRIEAAMATNPRGEIVQLRRAVQRWQIGTGLAAAASVVLAVLAIRPAPPVPAPTQIASAAPSMKALAVALAPGPQNGPVMLVYIPSERRMLAMARGFAHRAGHDYQLWLIPAGGKPIALGLLAGDGVQAMNLPQKLIPAIDAQASLALSLEPEGGSPTGLPTGPVLASGKINAT